MDKKEELLCNLELEEKSILKEKNHWIIHLIYPLLVILFTTYIINNTNDPNKINDIFKDCLFLFICSIIMLYLQIKMKNSSINYRLFELQKLKKYISNRSELKLTKLYKNPIIISSPYTYSLPGDRNYNWDSEFSKGQFCNEYEALKAGYHRVDY